MIIKNPRQASQPGGGSRVTGGYYNRSMQPFNVCFVLPRSSSVEKYASLYIRISLSATLQSQGLGLCCSIPQPLSSSSETRPIVVT